MQHLPFRVRLKAAARMVFSGRGGQSSYSGTGTGTSLFSLYGNLPGSETDWVREAGDVSLCAAVNACLHWYYRAFPSARLQVSQPNAEGTLDAIPQHPLTRLVARPNPYFGGDLLWQYTVKSLFLTGRAYWLKARGAGGHGQPLELWPVRPLDMRPVWPEDGSQFISGYEYRVNGRTLPLRREDVVHFRMDPDLMTREGRSPLDAVLREIAGENHASTYTAFVLKHMGPLGVAVVPGDTGVSITNAEPIRQEFLARTTGDKRGQPLILSEAVKIEKIGFSPEEMALDQIRTWGQDYICSAFGLNPMVVNLTSGAAHKTFANYAEANEAAIEKGMIPLQHLCASEIQAQLLPDFGDAEGLEVGWDYSQVRELQPDQDALWSRWLSALDRGGVSINEFRSAVGLKPAGPEFDAVEAERREAVAQAVAAQTQEAPENEPAADEENEEDER